MFKKSLSLLLCIVIFLSCFMCTAQAVTDSETDLIAKSLFSVTSSPVRNGYITYTISITANQNNVAGTVLLVEYDSSVIKPVNCSPATTTTTDKGTVNNFSGEFIHGVTQENSNMYSIAYMNSVAVSTGSTAKAFFNMVFQVVDSSRPKTDVSFYCREYYSTQDTEKNIQASETPAVIRKYENVVTLEAPVAGAISPATDGFNLTWSPVIGADGYIIYRSSPSSGKAVVGQLDNKNASSFTDTQNLQSGVTYTYTIAAVNNTGSQSVESSPLVSKFIAKPVISSVNNAAGGVEIRWTKAEGAQQYNIMRRTADTAWTKIASRMASLDTYFKDTTVKDGVEYEYDVNSATDTFESVTASYGEKIVYVKTPDFKSIQNVFGGIELKWSAHSNASYYSIYRRDISTQDKLEWYCDVNSTSYLDTQVEAGKTYTYSIMVVTSSGDKSAYNLTGYNITCVPSTTVTALSTEKASILVEWNAVENVDGYNIYRKTASSESWTKAGTVPSGVTTFSDGRATSGAQYCYAVCPIKNESEGAKVASSVIYYIQAPAGVVATNEQNGVKVSWASVSGATAYIVNRVDGDGTATQVGTVNVNSVLDAGVEDGEKYTYTVIAVNTLGDSKSSDSSNTLYRWNEEITATPAHAMGGIKVTWAKKSNADSYVLYRGVDNVWTAIAKVEEPSYLDTDVVSNKIYSYAVGLVIEDSISTVYKPAKPQLRYIAPASDIVATNSVNYTQLTWSAVDGAVKYYVYKADSLDGEYKLIATTDADNRKVYDKNLTSGELAYYSVKSYNGENMSAHSEGKRNVYLDYPVMKSATNEYTGQKFTWSAVKGATAYRIYRKVYGAKYYTYVTTVNANTLSYTDTGAVNGKAMCYTVRATNGTSISAYKGICTTYIEAPTIAISNSPSGVFLRWDKNEVAQGYYVYRKVAGAKYWTRIATVTTLYYTDRNVKSGTNYLYTVKAYKGKVLSGCNMDGWKLMHLATPVLYSQVNGYGAITTFWRAVPGAQYYNVYRKADKETSWTYMGKTTALYYRDATVKNLSTYTYTVRAVSTGNISSFDYAGKTIKYLIAPTLKISNSTTGVYLQWDRITGASSYYLYRKAGNAKYWTKIDTVTGNSYLDRNVKPGYAYSYTIRAYGSKTLSGCNSAGWRVLYLKTPELVSALSYPSGIQVKWKKVPVATSYAVYRKAEGDKSWTLIGTTTGNSKVAYLDETAVQGVTYTYTVRACYGSYRSWFKSGITCKANY